MAANGSSLDKRLMESPMASSAASVKMVASTKDSALAPPESTAGEGGFGQMEVAGLAGGKRPGFTATAESTTTTASSKKQAGTSTMPTKAHSGREKLHLATNIGA